MSDRVVGNHLDSQNWEFVDSDTRYLTHSIHRFSGKYIPQIPKTLLQITSSPDSLVLDPFAGSGTTLLEAALAGRKSLGYDLNPAAILIGKVKTTPIEVNLLTERTEVVKRKIGTIIAGRKDSAQTTLVPVEELKSPVLQDPWFKKWFQPHVLRELVMIKEVVDSEKEERVRRLLLVVFSQILRRVSNAHQSYPNVMYNKALPKRPLPAELFQRNLAKVVDKVRNLEGAFKEQYQPIYEIGDARNIPLGDSSVDTIITHPPYIGSIPYAEYQQLSLKWLGHDSKELDSTLTGGRRQRKDVVERFERDMRENLAELKRVGKPDSIVSIVIGNPVVRGKRIEIDRFLIEESHHLGMNLIRRIVRGKYNTRASNMTEEYILVLRNA